MGLLGGRDNNPGGSASPFASPWHKYEIAKFHAKLNEALTAARQVLNDAKNPCFLADVPHEFEDTYHLAEAWTNTALRSVVEVLTALDDSCTQDGGAVGGKKVVFEKLPALQKNGSVVLRFRCGARSTLLREETREVESKHKVVQQTKTSRGIFGGGGSGEDERTTTTSVVTTVTDYYWTVQTEFEITAGNLDAKVLDAVSLVRKTGAAVLKTASKTPPRPDLLLAERGGTPPLDITFLLQNNVAVGGQKNFCIDRTSEACHTPRRNDDTAAAVSFFMQLAKWTQGVLQALEGEVFARVLDHVGEPVAAREGEGSQESKVETTHVTRQSFSDACAEAVRSTALQPAVLPLFVPEQEVRPASAAGQTEGKEKTRKDAHREHRYKLGECEAKALAAVRSGLQKQLGDHEQSGAGKAKDTIASGSAAFVYVALAHLARTAEAWGLSINYLEALLRQRLQDAIGKMIGPRDFSQYMQFHHQQLFRPDRAPKGFSYAIRRSPKHSAEASLSLETIATDRSVASNGATIEPVHTLTNTVPAQHVHSEMTFPLSATANVKFLGQRNLHFWLVHEFSQAAASHQEILLSGYSTGASFLKFGFREFQNIGTAEGYETKSRYFLAARARQFSHVVAMVGRIKSATEFEPTHAALVQNKAELRVPLDLSVIPSASEFRDAIESLSQPQQDFAKAFRNMQLQSTLFAVLIVEVKPQLERALNLPADSLTKEIQLTQDLMRLFVKYQIPTDLLNAGANGAGALDDHLDGFVDVKDGQRGLLEQVRNNVRNVQEVIKKGQLDEVEEEELRRRPNHYTSSSSSSEDFRRGSSMYQDRCLRKETTRRMSPRAAEPASFRSANVAPAGGALFGGSANVAQSANVAPAGGGLFGGSATVAPNSSPFDTAAAAMDAFAPESAKRTRKATLSAGKGAAKGGGSAPAPAAVSFSEQSAAPPAASAGSQNTFQPPDRAGAQHQQPATSSSTPLSAPNAHADYTSLPQLLEKRLEKQDGASSTVKTKTKADDAVRPTIISPGTSWSRTAPKSFFLKDTAETQTLSPQDLRDEKNQAFDLLDALTKSGALPITNCSLHVVIAATHCFDKMVEDVLVENNANPIEKVEETTLRMAELLHGVAEGAGREVLLGNAADVAASVAGGAGTAAETTSGAAGPEDW